MPLFTLLFLKYKNQTPTYVNYIENSEDAVWTLWGSTKQSGSEQGNRKSHEVAGASAGISFELGGFLKNIDGPEANETFELPCNVES